MHSLPESEVTSDGLRNRIWLGVGPGRVRVERTTNANVEVFRGAFDRTDRRACACLEQALVNRGGCEVVVSFDDDRLVACDNGGVFPNC